MKNAPLINLNETLFITADICRRVIILTLGFENNAKCAEHRLSIITKLTRRIYLVDKPSNEA